MTTQHAIATPHALATQVGVEIFAAGGNAIDAAIGAASTLAVVYPHQCSVGGDLFALVDGGAGRTWAVNGSGAASRSLDVAAFRKRNREIPESGPESVTVPGAVAAWGSIHELGAVLPFARLLRPAIQAAQEGVAVSKSLAAAIQSRSAVLRRDPGMRALFLPEGQALPPDAILRQLPLARTLETLASDGPESLYSGPMGEKFALGLEQLGSTITRLDLAEHRTEVGPPLTLEHRGYRLQTTAPNSQGFCLFAAVAALDAIGVEIDPLGSNAHYLLYALLLAAEDREAYLGDPRRRGVPLPELLAPERLRQRLRKMAAAPRSTLTASAAAHGDTVAVCTADSDGLAVSLIQSVYQTFGASVLETQTGIILHNRGRGFSLSLGAPNELVPGTRPAHTLMPLLVHKKERLVAAMGTMGGRAQPQILAQLLPGVLAPDMPLAEVLRAPRWVVGSTDIGFGHATVAIESDAPAELDSILAANDLDVQRIPSCSEQVGHAQTVRMARDGALQAASDPRSDGAARVIAS
jgi:oxamate amidohydrolase